MATLPAVSWNLVMIHSSETYEKVLEIVRCYGGVQGESSGNRDSPMEMRLVNQMGSSLGRGDLCLTEPFASYIQLRF